MHGAPLDGVPGQPHGREGREAHGYEGFAGRQGFEGHERYEEYGRESYAHESYGRTPVGSHLPPTPEPYATEAHAAEPYATEAYATEDGAGRLYGTEAPEPGAGAPGAYEQPRAYAYEAYAPEPYAPEPYTPEPYAPQPYTADPYAPATYAPETCVPDPLESAGPGSDPYGTDRPDPYGTAGGGASLHDTFAVGMTLDFPQAPPAAPAWGDPGTATVAPGPADTATGPTGPAGDAGQPPVHTEFAYPAPTSYPAPSPTAYPTASPGSAVVPRRPAAPPVGRGGRPVPPPTPAEETMVLAPIVDTPGGQRRGRSSGAGPDRGRAGRAPASSPTPARTPSPVPFPLSGPLGRELPPEVPVASQPAHSAAPTTASAAPAPRASAEGPGTEAPRLTAAQRARAEGRSPVIEPGLVPAALTALLAVLLGVAAAAPVAVLVLPLVLLQAVTAAGWFRLNGMWPARQGIALAFLGGLVADAALLAGGRGNAPVALLGALVFSVLLTLVLQLRSHAAADERMTALMATLTSAALTVVAAGHLAAEPEAVSLGAAGVIAGILVRALPLPTPVSVVLALAASAGAGAGLAQLATFAGDATTTEGAVIGAVAGLCALVGHRAASYDYPSRFVHMTAGVALPLAAAAPGVYLAGRLLLG